MASSAQKRGDLAWMAKRSIETAFPALWSRLRVLRLRYSIATYKRRRVTHAYGPFLLTIELRDGLGAGWYDRDWPELPEFRFLNHNGRLANAHVFNLGAHQGIVALILSRYVRPEGSVLAVEANEHNVAAARCNVDLNSVDNCIILRAVVAEKSGIIAFTENLNGNIDNNSHWGRVRLPGYSIDELAHDYGMPDLVFMDIEGYEYNALRGATNVLANRTDMFIEVHLGHGLESFGGSAERVLNYFPANDYSLYYNSADGAEFRPLKGELPRERFFLIALAKRD